MQDFKDELVAFSKVAVTRSERVTSEEAAKQYLILPFFQLLGYDPLDPDEIIPEAQASFSDKFKNKVDYAICIDREPVIGVECKRTGELATADKGEIRGYFNAVPSIKLGILTDGLVYELYSDTDSENMMDENPFVKFDLANVAQEQLNDQAADALWKLRKGTFDPADVGADAKRKIYVAQYVATLNRSFENPSDIFVRALMDLAGVEGRRTVKLLEEHVPMVRESLQLFLDRKILERVGFASRQDLVKVQQAQSERGTPDDSEGEQSVEISHRDGIITTDTELMLFDYVKGRLAFLVDNNKLFRKIQELQFVDYKTIFSVYYKQERKGRLFSFREGTSGKFRFDFPESEEPFEVTDLYQIDEPLLQSFLNRVADVDG